MPIQPICQWRAPTGTKRGQHRQMPFGTGPQICAYLARGHGSSVSTRASSIRGSFRPAFGFFSHCLRTRRYVVLTPRPVYRKLRAPRGFVMPSFAMYDGSTDPYDHMLHFNQTMILSAGNDCLMCKVFPASLKGPALAWFHKLLRGSINRFSDLWTTFISQYLCSVRQKGNIISLQAILKREEESIRDFTRRFGQDVQQIDTYSMDAIL